MAKKRYAVVASFAAACMMVAGFGAGSANAAETSGNTDQPAKSNVVDLSQKSERPLTKLAPVASQTNAAPAPQVEYPTVSDKDEVRITNVKVTDVGAHTANISFDYQYMRNGQPLNWKSVNTKNSKENPDERWPTVPMVSLTHITSMTARSDQYGCGTWNPNECTPFGGYAPEVGNNNVMDTQLTADTYQKIYGVKTQDWMNPMSGLYRMATTTGKSFERFLDEDMSRSSGHFDVPLIGLDPNTTYSNRNVNANGKDLSLTEPEEMIGEHAKELVAQGKKDQPVKTDIMQLLVGVNFENMGYGGPTPQYGQALIPSFTTKAEPKAPANGDLNTGNMNDIGIAGKPTAGSPSRLYINHLAAGCKADVDGEDTPSCFWAGYIYSDPVALQGPDGAPYLQVKKDDKGRYYVDALLPKGYTGDHKIALVDQDGNLQGWTPITFGKDYGKEPIVLPPPAGTPAPPAPAAPAPTAPAAPGVTQPANSKPAPTAAKDAAAPAAKKLANTGTSVAGVLLVTVSALLVGAGVELARRKA
ncbi:hypothetical protein OZX67_09205 [Bifidobacterium sp. ESL0728]|uniref:hypothetical protein n=1 Tax=Bifidobacterium sp. ESL0728 TaxID=2983220 RepID=UPI0023F64390|nr:hypothetical protein [Bifidobacterium sp. ESL0728]WEV58946.1 hypothetical protein OZX67_09205 [Bifidobacterium sp. ESL0728]